MSTRIPHLLEPYLVPSPGSAAGPPQSHNQSSPSLILLTGVLGATTNWLVLRYVYSHVLHSASHAGGVSVTAPTTGLGPGERGVVKDESYDEQQEDDSVGVVLVSFMRDLAFWKEGASKMGLDLEKLRQQQRFSFVDGLTGPLLHGELGVSNDRQQAASASSGTVSQSPNTASRDGVLDRVQRQIEAALGQVHCARKTLIVDGLDMMLAVLGGGEINSMTVQNMLFSLRERVTTTVLALSADEPLLQAPHTTLEKEHANLVLSLAHQADYILGLRMLDTGRADDISGVIRITEDDAEEGREYLYNIGADGGVKVFERGT